MALELILGLGIVAFLFLFFAFKLDEDHFLLKLLLIFFFIGIILLIPNASVNDSCQLLVANSTTGSGLHENVTFTEYKEICSPDIATTTETNFLRLVLWFFRIFVTYFSIYLFYHWAKSAEVVNKWIRGRK